MGSHPIEVERVAFTQAEAARYLGVTERTIQIYRSNGILPAHRMGPRAIRIYKEDLDALLHPEVPATSRKHESVEAQRDEAAERMANYIERTLKSAPPLTDEQRASLTRLFRPLPKAPLGGDAA